MLQHIIKRWEHRHHGRDTNRVTLPFEWGLDHLGISASTDPDAALRKYARAATSDSDSFYGYEPTNDYQFDGDILRYPSFIETPYRQNNTVVARFFQGGKDMAVVVLPQWNCKWNGQVGLCQMMQRSGISALRLSLPYHHDRKPAEIQRAEYLVSPNIGRTLTAVRQAVIDARRAADWLLAQGYRRIAIVGTSIGSCIGFLTFLHDPRFSSGVFIHVSGYFADVVWDGLSTTHVRKAFEGRVDLESLREYWQPISPFGYIPRLKGTSREMLMLSGSYDLTFPPALTEDVYREFTRHNIPAQTVWFPCGHYTMGKLPFSAMIGYRIQRFLARQNRRAGVEGAP